MEKEKKNGFNAINRNRFEMEDTTKKGKVLYICLCYPVSKVLL